MERYALILTGGTIASKAGETGLFAAEGQEVPLLSRYYEKGGKLRFDVIAAESLLSENFSFSVMRRLARTIGQACRDYRAVAVLTGTDNLANFANYLAFALRYAPAPVFLVSSQFPLDDRRENGSDNLLAFDAAARRFSRGVYVLNRNLAEREVKVHAAARIKACVAPSGDFYSVPKPLDRIKNGRFYKNEPTYSCFQAFYREDHACKVGEDALCAEFGGGDLFCFRATPYAAPQISRRPDAVLISAYHSGTAAVSGEASLLPFLREMQKNAVPVYFAPAYFRAARYETTVQIERSGVIFLTDTTEEAAETKLRIAFGKSFPAGLKEAFLSGNFAGERLFSEEAIDSAKI